MFRFIHNLIAEKRIRYQIKVYLKWRDRRGLLTRSSDNWLQLFKKVSKCDDVFDITPEDILTFVGYVRYHYNGEYQALEAEKAIRHFVRFYTARGKVTGNLAEYNYARFSEGVSLLANVDRNKDLVRKRLKDPKTWSWRRLGRHFGIHCTTARQIFLRDVEKYSKGLKEPPPDLKPNFQTIDRY